MSDNSTTTEILIQYLDGELPEEEISRLEQEISSRKDLQEKLENLRATRRSLQLFGLQKQVNAIHQEMAPQLRKPSLYIRMRSVGLRVAAVLLVILSLLTFYQYRQLSPDSLYHENYRPYTATATRGSQDSMPLLQMYKEGKAADVIELYSRLSAPTLRDHFLAGNAYLTLNIPAEAIHSFITVEAINRQQHTHVFEDDTEYYLAMSYLKNGQTDLALPIFEKIHNDPAHPYHDRVSSWFLRKLHWLH